MRLSVYLSFCLILIACSPGYSGKQPPKVINGEIDLTDWNFRNDGPIKLEGDWLFAWNELIEPANWETLQNKMTSTTEVPGMWHSLENPAKPGNKLSGTGFASYALRVYGLSGDQKLALCIRGHLRASQTSILSTAGELINSASQGSVGMNINQEQPAYDIPVILESTGQDQVLLINISNHHLPTGGYWQAMSLGFKEQVSWEYHTEFIFQSLLTGILLIVGLHHLILVSQRRRDLASLYFGLFCLFSFVRSFAMGVGQSFIQLPGLTSWSWFQTLEYMSMPAVVITSSLFLNKLFPGRFIQSLVHILFLSGLPLILSTLFLTPFKFADQQMLFQIHLMCGVFLLAFYLIYLSLKHVKLAGMILFAFIVMICGVIHDILLTNGLLESVFMAPFTTLFFIIVQSGIISFNNSNAYAQAEHLSKKLGDEVKLKNKKLKRIQQLSQQIRNTSNLNQMLNSIIDVIDQWFIIPMYTFQVIDAKNNLLEVLHIHLQPTSSEPAIDDLTELKIDLSQPNSISKKIITRGRSFYIRRMRNWNPVLEEMKFVNAAKITSLFTLPLKIDGEAFAFLTLASTEFENENQVKSLSKDDRNDLELLSEYISAALYQTLQKDKIEQAEIAASWAKSEVAVNQMVTHLAHEVNNPLTYIVNGKTIQQDAFDNYHKKILSVLSEDDDESKSFIHELKKLYGKFALGLDQTYKGHTSIAKVITEIRAVTGVDGTHYSKFDIAPIVYEELLYMMLKNQITKDNLKVKVTGTEQALVVWSNSFILARAIRTIISNSIHFARKDHYNDGELFIHCKLEGGMIYIDIGNNSYSIKTKNLEDLFDLERNHVYGTEQIGIAMIRELLHKVNANLILADHGRKSGNVVFQIQIPVDG